LIWCDRWACAKVLSAIRDMTPDRPSGRITGFYEKVIKVKADLAAVLVLRKTLD
jgi:hypothetical protein